MNNFTDLKFHKVLVRSRHGLIWGGEFRGQPCAIKMLILNSGLYYDSEEKSYRNQNKIVKPATIFNRDDQYPFLHTEFKVRKAQDRERFLRQANKLKLLSDLGLGVKFYRYIICDQVFEVHYGFIVMDKADCSVKDILLKRPLYQDEEQVVKTLINQMHNKYEIVHGDLKPSNIGVYLKDNGRIQLCRVFDCSNVKHRKDYSENKFNELIKKDWDNYKEHIIRNKKHR